MEVVNNFENLEKWMIFESGRYYKFVALIRTKDFKNKKNNPVLNTNERGEIFVRQWFIDSQDSLDKYKDDMINLCNATKARLYVTVDRKSIKKTILTMKDQLDVYIKQMVYNPNTHISIRKLSKFSASASQMAECSKGPKYWMIDIDTNKLDKTPEDNKIIALNLCSYFKSIFSNKICIKNITLNGVHLLIERTFDIYKKLSDFTLGKEKCTEYAEYDNTARSYILKYADCWEVKENALTLIYANFND